MQACAHNVAAVIQTTVVARVGCKLKLVTVGIAPCMCCNTQENEAAHPGQKDEEEEEEEEGTETPAETPKGDAAPKEVRADSTLNTW